MTSVGDLGLFGPDSVTWRVHGDPTMLLGGLRSLFLQALHPLAMAGVEQHSGFRDDPWGRLFRTAEYVTVVAFGTTAEAQRAGARVRGIHRGLTGIEPESGARYQVDDPDLLRWVHCAEVESFFTTYRRAGGPLRPGDADRYYAEQRRAAELVGLGADTVPGSVGEMADYFAGIRPALRLTAPARAALWFVHVPPMPVRAWPTRPAWAGIAGLSFALQPRWARRMYGAPGLQLIDVGASAAVRAFRSAAMLVPATLRDGARVKDAQRRAAELRIVAG
ncbi:MAG TPA: oxygenase MpaB family protein [Mycobacteriales bacterium]|nr:oxygenase MpaB family protein [Mycobacteriales bacterium]